MPPSHTFSPFDVIAAAVGMTVSNAKEATRLALVPAALLTLADGFTRALTPAPEGLEDLSFVEQAQALLPGIFTTMLLSWLCILPFLTRWVRFCISETQEPDSFGYGRPEQILLLRLLQLDIFWLIVPGVLALLIMGFFSGAGNDPEQNVMLLVQLTVFFLFFTTYWTARLSLILARACLREPSGLAWSLRATKGHGVRILLSFLAVLLPYAIASMVALNFLQAFGLAGPGAPASVDALFKTALTFGQYALVGALLAVLYKRLTTPGADMSV